MRSRVLRLGLSAFGAALLAAACSHGGAAPPSSNEQDAEIYRLVLATAQSRTVVRATQAPPPIMGTAEERLALHARNLPPLDTSTVRSFLERNRVSVPLPELGDSTLELVSEEERLAGLDTREPRWAHGAMILSRIGYSRDGAQALVYVIAACPQLCGGADYVLLVRTGGRWSVIGEAGDWKS